MISKTVTGHTSGELRIGKQTDSGEWLWSRFRSRCQKKARDKSKRE